MPHLRKHIHNQKRQHKILLTQMQKRSQTQSRQRIHAQMASRKPRKERRATQTRRPRCPSPTRQTMPRQQSRTRSRLSQSLPTGEPRNRGRPPTQMETIPLRNHRIQGRLPKMGATQPRGSRGDSCTQSQSGSRRQCDTRPHPSQMGGQQRNLLSLRRTHQSRPQVARPYVADSGTQSPDRARRSTRHRQHRLRPSSLQQQQRRSNHRGVHGATEARQLGHPNPLEATQQGYEGVTSLLKPAQDPGAIHA